MADELLTLGANAGTDVTNTVYEEHTVSGSVVTFSDGADDVPLKKCEVTIAPTLDGYSEVNVAQSGKNLFSFEKDQTITTLKTFNLRLLAGSYTFSWDFISTTAETLPAYMQVSFLCDDGATVYNPVSFIQGRMTRSFTLAKNVTSINIYANTSYNASMGITTVIENIQLEVGNTSSAFEPYSGATHTATLGRTIYGGTVDVVKGQAYSKNLADFSGNAEPTYSGLTITANADGSITFSGTPSRTWAHLTTDFAVDLPIGTYALGRGASASYAMYIAVKYEDNTTENISMATSASKTFTTTKRIIQIRLDIATLNQSTNYNEIVFVQLEEGNTATSYSPYFEPFTFTPVPINSKLGNNTIWSEQGTNIELTYYSEREVINNYNVTATQLTAIADAIREKKGTTNPILFEDFPDEIRTIETGGGGGVKSVEWVYTAGTNGTGNTYNYTAVEAGLYLAVAIRYQNTGCSISLPDGGTTVLTSSLSSNRIQLKVVQIEANQRIQMGIYDSSHSRGGWIFKLNVTPNAIAYRRESDSYGDQSFVNQGTSNTVLSIVCTTGTNKFYKWDKTMECYITSPLTAVAQVRIMYGVDMTMPTIVENGPITGQWILSLAED